VGHAHAGNVSVFTGGKPRLCILDEAAVQRCLQQCCLKLYENIRLQWPEKIIKAQFDARTGGDKKRNFYTGSP